MQYQEALMEYPGAFAEYQEAFMEYQEAPVDYPRVFMEYQKALSNTIELYRIAWSSKEYEGAPSQVAVQRYS